MRQRSLSTPGSRVSDPAALYEKPKEIRAIAAAMRDTSVRDELLDLAERFDLLAVRAAEFQARSDKRRLSQSRR